MKIAFLGNTNNHPFHVAKFFKDRGHDVIVYIDAAENDLLHRPEALTYDIKYPYPEWIINEPKLEGALWMHFPQFFAAKILKELNTCDAIVTNHYGHRFIPFLKKKIIKICMFTGGDLETMADYDNVLKMRAASPKLKMLPKFIKKWYARFSVDQLRNGIRKADLISYFPEGLIPLGDKLLHEIFGKRKYNKYEHWGMFIDGVNYTLPADNEQVKLLNVARFLWKEPFPPGMHSLENKRNDVMLEGIAIYLKKSDKTLDIHFIEKGLQVNETKELISQLGFAHMVTWHKEMPMSELLVLIEKSDIIFDQLGQHTIGAGIFGMLKGRPLIASSRPEIISRITTDEIPVCEATTAEEVAEWLSKLVNNPELRKEIGIQSSTFANRNCDINKQAKFYLNFITEKLKD